MNVIRNGKMASKTRNSIRRKKGFQMFRQPSQDRKYAKLKKKKNSKQGKGSRNGEEEKLQEVGKTKRNEDKLQRS
ncbi:hypothetical protein HYC85_030298 [Camellia sinensis]|uniref:Uncharacterized protein n=1 Tax=Camellia sinensis TaxID=4442 RepID=A0A7J7G104_CAMSI|nr:hypothetical protein HYC85_030298 [Camellia sinensis]